MGPSPVLLLYLPDGCSPLAADGQVNGSAKQGLAGLPGQANLHRDSIRAGYPEAPRAESSWNDWNDSEGKAQSQCPDDLVSSEGHADIDKSSVGVRDDSHP